MFSWDLITTEFSISQSLWQEVMIVREHNPSNRNPRNSYSQIVNKWFSAFLTREESMRNGQNPAPVRWQ